MFKFTHICGLCCVIALSACSSSTGGVGGGTDVPGGTGGTSLGAPGAGSGTLTVAAFSSSSGAVATVINKISTNQIKAPTTNPARTAKLKGLVAVGSGQPNEAVIGNLTVDANFSGGSYTAQADGFKEVSVPDGGPVTEVNRLGITGGTLTGSGTLSTTDINGTLSGDVMSSVSGNYAVNGTMTGKVYDENGLLITTGNVGGTIQAPGQAANSLEGNFFATE